MIKFISIAITAKLIRKLVTLSFVLFPLLSSAQQQEPACLDPKSKTCSEENCTTFIQKLCWLNDYLQKGVPGSGFLAEKFQRMQLKSSSDVIFPSNTPWGSYYFPYHNGGICQRWQVSTSKNHIIESDSTLDLSKLKLLTSDELSKLSPALKMDLYIGDTAFSITKMELTRRSRNRALELTKHGYVVSERNGGFCNGARAAGVLWPEPINKIIVRSPIPGFSRSFAFYPTDLKALLAASFFHPQHANNFGDRQCQIDPVTFDVMLRLMISGLHRPFFIDADLSSNIDNKTVLKYDRKVQAITSLPNGMHQATVVVKLMTLAEFGPTLANSITKNGISKTIQSAKLAAMPIDKFNDVTRPKFQFYIYKYTLAYDDKNRIVSGDWVHEIGYTRPDFAWVAWGVGNDDCSAYDDLNNAGDPVLSFTNIQRLLSKGK